jgi:hypothetical protein
VQLEEIRKEVEIISQSHERDVDRKDAVLQMLDRDVDEAEEQYQVALRQHLRNIDAFIDVHVRARLGCARGHAPRSPSWPAFALLGLAVVLVLVV